jgi:iron complex outermembrane receptor protein
MNILLRSHRTSARLSALLVLLSSVAGQVTLAVTATGTPADSGGLEEIVVTAEKRNSTVQDTPISMTALSGDQLLSQGITTVEDIAPQDPGKPNMKCADYRRAAAAQPR